MSSVTVVTDSVACLSPGLCARLGIEIVPLYLTLDGHTYRDNVDVTAAELFARMRDDDVHKTAAPAVGDWLEAMERAVAAGAQALLVVTVSHRVSGTDDAARSAAQLCSVPAAVIDSRTAASTQGLFVRRRLAEVAREARAGRNWSRWPGRLRGSYFIEFVLAGLKRLAASGRMPAAAARIGDAVDVKAVLTFDESGAVHLAGAVRRHAPGGGAPAPPDPDRLPRGDARAGRVVEHVLLDDEAQALAARLRDERPALEIDVALFTPVMGVNTGALIGISWEAPSVEAAASARPGDVTTRASPGRRRAAGTASAAPRRGSRPPR